MEILGRVITVELQTSEKSGYGSLKKNPRPVPLTEVKKKIHELETRMRHASYKSPPLTSRDNHTDTDEVSDIKVFSFLFLRKTNQVYIYFWAAMPFSTLFTK